MRTKFILILMLGMVLFGCKPTEANYRQAYERATAERDSTDELISTIYGAQRRQIGVSQAIVEGDTAQLRSVRVRITGGGGAIRENLKPYSVVVGEFKQKFNAVSMRERLVDNGFPTAFVVETGEPYYFVVLSSFATRAEAMKALKAIDKPNFPVVLKAPLPILLYSPR